jgi:hypothetical protein
MKLLRNKNTGELSYFDEKQLHIAKKENTKIVNKFKLCKETAILEDLETP